MGFLFPGLFEPRVAKKCFQVGERIMVGRMEVLILFYFSTATREQIGVIREGERLGILRGATKAQS